MADTYQRLAALRPANTDEAALYLVPAATSIIAQLTICNQDGSARTVDVAHCDATGAASGEDWLLYGYSLAANTSTTIKIFAGAAEEIRIKAGVADKLSFVLEGLKVT
jgi:hypothetical protein